MGAVANMRPDLFRAIVADVPFVDVINTMSDASLPLTAQEWEQWGNPAVPEQYAYMRTYSPYDNVAAKDYPWMLVTTSLNDSQVMYWEPAKWVARLRSLKTDQNPSTSRPTWRAVTVDRRDATSASTKPPSVTRSCWTRSGWRGRRPPPFRECIAN
jgi:prolyl oligopeptidase PreP (S9A serine peptidase family)